MWLFHEKGGKGDFCCRSYILTIDLASALFLGTSVNLPNPSGEDLKFSFKNGKQQIISGTYEALVRYMVFHDDPTFTMDFMNTSYLLIKVELLLSILRGIWMNDIQPINDEMLRRKFFELLRTFVLSNFRSRQFFSDPTWKDFFLFLPKKKKKKKKKKSTLR
eukprot:TRINITY_DN17284_c0_g1_i1.p1 TRINITY_DN17284_c0_g1~~TRINITY_DN17284_c0_g1_i1.p1  ORF type:complete len:162 (+),score=19.04 TRINITY_DN17284_c0_g1_i1:80-565(+)